MRWFVNARRRRQAEKVLRLIRKTAWERIKREYGFACANCGRKEPEIKLTRDHIRPLSRGGMDIPENIQPLCIECNLRKGNSIPSQQGAVSILP